MIQLIGHYAGVAELADAPDLGSGVSDVQVQVLSPAPYRVFLTKVRTLDFFVHEYFVFGAGFPALF